MFPSFLLPTSSPFLLKMSSKEGPKRVSEGSRWYVPRRYRNPKAPATKGSNSHLSLVELQWLHCNHFPVICWQKLSKNSTCQVCGLLNDRQSRIVIAVEIPWCHSSKTNSTMRQYNLQNLTHESSTLPGSPGPPFLESWILGTNILNYGSVIRNSQQLTGDEPTPHCEARPLLGRVR